MSTLLIIDDEPNVRYSLKSSLESDNLLVETAATAKQGLAAVRDQCPDIVLLDLRLFDMSGTTQAKVLRLLQDQQFERIGGNETIQTDVRIIAATNQNLEELVAAGRFRTDLYYRLKVYTIELPPLRERLEDIPLLVEYFANCFSCQVGKRIRVIAPETIAVLERYFWPGNVRELQATIKSALVNATSDVLTPSCLPEGIRRGAQLTRQLLASERQEPGVRQLVRSLLVSGEQDIYRKTLLAVDQPVLSEVLSHVSGNQVEASRRLGISRTTLRAKLRVLQMAVEEGDGTDSGQGDQT